MGNECLKDVVHPVVMTAMAVLCGATVVPLLKCDPVFLAAKRWLELVEGGCYRKQPHILPLK